MKKMILAMSLAAAMTASQTAQAETLLVAKVHDGPMNMLEQAMVNTLLPLHQRFVTRHYFDHFQTPHTPRQVRTLQRSLALRGCDPGAIDGVIGPKTLAAMQNCYYRYW